MGEPWENLGNLSQESGRRATKRGRTTWENLGRTLGTLAENPADVPPREGERWVHLGRTLATFAENPTDLPPREGEPLGRTLGEPWENLGNFSRESSRRATERGRTTWENLKGTLATLARNPADLAPREGEPLGRTVGEPWLP